MDEKLRRGRPPTFSAADRQQLAELIRQHGIRGALRSADIRVSPQTLSKIAREFGIVLRPGRRLSHATSDTGNGIKPSAMQPLVGASVALVQS